ncbi:hypothetical protein RFM68_23890 [Mesorhizobium sp. MSK_1335]|uniref:Uncharacterized protein n=1 Tax=Mesorhizobium montanum TaxID=3072323 RepID=A0ABU4ZUC4_9HYPH|nr:hypothetical protein [Mesorhizobium sp. MSK_1335]MDX8527546.1 hypothetical protein [Mesorhizobium sp. MSK_1335]
MNSALTKIQQILSAIFFGIAVSCVVVAIFAGRLFESFDRPQSPSSEKGFTSLVHNKMGSFYGTPFEGFAANHGMLVAMGLVLVGGLLSPEIRRGEKPVNAISARFFGSAAILSFVALLALWWSGL